MYISLYIRDSSEYNSIVTTAHILDYSHSWHFAWLGKILANNILKYYSLFFLENRIWHFMQIVSLEDNVHEVSDPIF